MLIFKFSMILWNCQKTGIFWSDLSRKKISLTNSLIALDRIASRSSRRNFSNFPRAIFVPSTIDKLSWSYHQWEAGRPLAFKLNSMTRSLGIFTFCGPATFGKSGRNPEWFPRFNLIRNLSLIFFFYRYLYLLKSQKRRDIFRAKMKTMHLEIIVQ